MAYIVMAYIVMAYIVMAYVVMACIVMAYIVMAALLRGFFAGACTVHMSRRHACTDVYAQGYQTGHW